MLIYSATNKFHIPCNRVKSTLMRWRWRNCGGGIKFIVFYKRSWMKTRTSRTALLRELLADSKAATVWLNLNIESSLKRDGIYFPSCGLINKNNRSNRINLHRREKRSPPTHPRGEGRGAGGYDRNDREGGGVEDGSVSILTRNVT